MVHGSSTGTNKSLCFSDCRWSSSSASGGSGNRGRAERSGRAAWKGEAEGQEGGQTQHTLSSAHTASRESDPGQAYPACLWFSRPPRLPVLSFSSPAMDQATKSTQETIDKTANQVSETVSGFGKKFGLLK